MSPNRTGTQKGCIANSHAREMLCPPFEWSACSWFRAGIIIKDVFGRRTSTGGSDAFSLLFYIDATKWVFAKYLYSCLDDLPENLGKIAAQECKTSTSG